MRAGPAASVYSAGRGVLTALLGLIETRLALFALELEEERERLVQIGIVAGIALVCAALAIGCTALFVIVLFWDTHRLLAIAGVGGAGLLGLGLCLLWIAKRGRHPLLIATRTELAADLDRLRGRGSQP